jgi:hypothetical protein
VEKFIRTPSSVIPVRERPTQLGRGVGQALRGLQEIGLLRTGRDKILVAGNFLAPVLVLKCILLVDADNVGGASLI